MSSIEAWNEVHKNRQWGTCPEPAVARWAMRRWGGRDKDAKGQVRLLEVGCGTGATAFWLAHHGGFLVDAIDSSEAVIERAEKLHGNIYPHSLRFTCWPVEQLTRQFFGSAVEPVMSPVRLDSYDGVVDVCCLQHVDDLGKALSTIKAVLREGGCLLSIIACKDHSPGVMTGELSNATFNRLSLVELFRVFSGWKTKVESMSHTDNGRNISHWIVEATK